MITMDVQDYEYYEARAKDVKMEDITSDEDNADVLERLRDDDPEFTSIHIRDEFQEFGDFVVREGDDLGWLGYFVGRSKELEYLNISDLPNNLKIDSFLRGLRHNRSIQKLSISIDLGDHFHSLAPLLKNNNNLRDLTFTCFNIGLQCARNIALLLEQRSSLKCLYFEDNNLGDEGLAEIAAALRTQPQIENLYFYATNIGRNGCVALGNVLEGMRNPALATLDLQYNRIDDEGLHTLVAGLSNCHHLTKLCLSGNALITEAGLRSLSTLFQSDHCRVECLSLAETNMDNDGAAAMSAGLASLPSLNKLNLSNNHIRDQGLQDLVGSLVNGNIEDLYLSNNSFSVLGLRSLGTLIQRATRLKWLNLCGNAIDDEGLQGLSEDMTQRCSLTHLDLSCNDSITAVGLTSLSTFFQSDKCCLKNLCLYGINFGDDGAVALADGLMCNKSLTNLNITSSNVAARGWSAFSRLLCDTSSVNDTYLSNHTITSINPYGMQGDTPPDIVKYLTLNNLRNCVAAIIKILDSHPDIDIEPLFQWKLKCLPLVVRWLETARSYMGNVNESTATFQCRKLSALYKFVRGMPQLSVDGYRGKKMKGIQSMSKKRKYDPTL